MKIVKHEKWVVSINHADYELDERQAEFLNDAIASGSRGIVQFDGFVVNIPFIQEFTRVKKWEEEVYTEEELAEQNRLRLQASQEAEKSRPVKTPEQIEKEKAEYKAWVKEEIERSKRIARGLPIKDSAWEPMPKDSFEKRRRELLEQAKSL